MQNYIEINGMKIVAGEDFFEQTDLTAINAPAREQDISYWFFKQKECVIENKVLGKEILLSKITTIGLLKKILTLLEHQFSSKDFYDFSQELNKISERFFDRTLDNLISLPEDWELHWEIVIQSY